MQNINVMSDLDLINGIKNDSNSGSCLSELISRHSGIYMTMVNNYTPNPSSSCFSYKNELISDKDYYIYRAALKFDESKNTKFPTYLGNETRWMCLNLYNKSKNKQSKEINIEESVISGESFKYKETSIQESQEFIDKIISILSEYKDSRSYSIFKMRYIDSQGNKVTPWRTISKHLNLSIQGCINIHNKTIKEIKKELAKDI